MTAVRAGDPDRVLPASDDPYFAPLLNYADEDAYLAELSAGAASLGP